MAEPERLTLEEETPGIRAYDFRHPGKFSKDQLYTLNVLHDTFARLLATQLSANFRVQVKVSVHNVEQVAYGDFLSRLESPSVLAVFTAPPLPGTCLLQMDARIAFPLIDRAFGGPGSGPAPGRPLTEIESSVLQRLLRGSLGFLGESWKNLRETTPHLESLESSPALVQIVQAAEIVVHIVLDVEFGGQHGNINLCIPFLTLEPVLAKLVATSWFAHDSGRVLPAAREYLAAHMEESQVPLVVVLGEATIPMRDLLELAPGDVLVLERAASDELPVMIGNRQKFLARPGKIRGRLAIQVTHVEGE